MRHKYVWRIDDVGEVKICMEVDDVKYLWRIDHVKIFMEN